MDSRLEFPDDTCVAQEHRICDALPHFRDAVDRNRDLVRVALHDHVGKVLASSAEGMDGVLKVFCKNRVQAICGRAKNGERVSQKLAIVAPPKQRMKRWKALYLRLFRRKNGNNLEDNFYDFRHQLHTREGISVVQSVQDLTPVVTRCVSTYGTTDFIKAQEVHCERGVELIVLGVRDDYPNGTPAMEVIEDAREHDGMVVLSTPFVDPDSVVLGTIRRIFGGYPHMELLEHVDAIEAYNQQIAYIPFLNYLASRLASKVNKPGVSCSDFHYYKSPRSRGVEQSAILLPRGAIDLYQAQNIVPSIRTAVKELFTQENRGADLSVRKTSFWHNLRQVLHLSPRDRKDLYSVPTPVEPGQVA